MSSPSTQANLSEHERPPPPVQWRSWPVRESFPTALAILGGMTLAGVLVGWLTGRTHLALLAVAVLGAAMWRFFVPTLFELNANGVSRWVLGRYRRIPWREIRRYQVCSTGVLLLPTADSRPTDAFRGLYLPWGKRRGEVLAQIHYYLDRPV